MRTNVPGKEVGRLTTVSGSSATLTPSRPSRKSRRRTYGILIVVVIAILCTVVAFTVPVSHSFSVTFSCPALYRAVYENLTFPLHTRVSGRWSSSHNTNVAFEIRTSDLQAIVYMPHLQGASGTFSFTADQSAYTIIAGSHDATTVRVAGTYSIPLL